MSSIVGLGIDLVEISRVKRLFESYGESFLSRLCSEEERRDLRGPRLRPESLAGRLAVKEAALKAFGTGWAGGLAFPDVVLTHENSSGRPVVSLRGNAARRARELGVTSIHVSISHDAGVAAAIVVFEGKPCG